MDKDIIQILWSALLIVIVTIVPLVKKFKDCLLYTSPSPRD